VRITAATWNLILGVILVSHGYQWAWVLFAVSAAIFSAAYILARGKPGARRSGQN
jgi:predicted acyltransferase